MGRITLGQNPLVIHTFCPPFKPEPHVRTQTVDLGSLDLFMAPVPNVDTYNKPPFSALYYYWSL